MGWSLPLDLSKQRRPLRVRRYFFGWSGRLRSPVTATTIGALEQPNVAVSPLGEASGSDGADPVGISTQSADLQDTPSTAQLAPGPLLQHVLSNEVAGSGEAPESLSDKRDRMSDLLQRLGLSADDRQLAFRLYAHTTYGRGWAERAADVDSMNERLAKALANPAELDREIAAARQPTFLD